MAMCPSCQAVLTSHEYVCRSDGSVQDGKPEPRPGDVSICGRCWAILIFDGEDRVRCATFWEAFAIARSPSGTLLEEAQRLIMQQRMMRERAN